jgi:hypothetical protein
MSGCTDPYCQDTCAALMKNSVHVMRARTCIFCSCRIEPGDEFRATGFGDTRPIAHENCIQAIAAEYPR